VLSGDLRKKLISRADRKGSAWTGAWKDYTVFEDGGQEEFLLEYLHISKQLCPGWRASQGD